MCKRLGEVIDVNTVTMTVSMRIQSLLEVSGLEQKLDCVMETLVDLTELNPNVSDPSMGVDLSEKIVEITLTASGESAGMAIDSMSELISQAVDEHGLNCRQIDSTFVAA